MLLPYRVKNPAKRFPFATVTLIALNVLVYMLTTDYWVVIKEGVVKDCAFALGISPFINSLWSMFLHGDPFHLLGNMLFLWVFGPPVEDRLGIPRYLGVYFITGLVGALLQAVLETLFSGHVSFCIGASGCIMGVVGAYWYLFSWSTVCVLYWFGYIWHGVWEVSAIWIIGLYILMDVFEGVFFGSMGASGGVANFAHVGGGVMGALMCLAMRAKRDSEYVSDAKAMLADTKDLSLMPVHALETMLEEDPDNIDLIRALVNAALRSHQSSLADSTIKKSGIALIEKDPSLIAMYLLDMHGDVSIYKPMHLLRLAGILEKSERASTALSIYQLIAQKFPTDNDSETALYRMALCYWKVFKDVRGCQSCLNEMAKRFPNGPMLRYGRTLWSEITSATKTPQTPN